MQVQPSETSGVSSFIVWTGVYVHSASGGRSEAAQ